MHSIEITLKVNVVDGPKITENIPAQNVDAFDKFIFKIEPNEKKEVALIPKSQEQEQLVFLLIKSNPYTVEQAGNDQVISYSFKDNGGDKTIVLDKAHLYQGTGQASLLAGDLSTLTFENKLPGDSDEEKKQNTAEIQILVGRKAVKTV